MDLEAELMDLGSNERAYLPPNKHPTVLRHSVTSPPLNAAPSGLAEQVADQLLAQATQQLGDRRQHTFFNTLDLHNTDEELLNEQQKQFLAEEDARLERRNAIVKELTNSRKKEIATRLDDLVLQFERQQQLAAERANANSGDAEKKRKQVLMEQMTAKLDFVVQHSALELQSALRGQKNGESGTVWTKLLEELPVEERDYLARAADEKFVEQMKYLRGDREKAREGVIQEHLHGLLVLTAPHHNGQKLAKTSVNHSLRHLLQAFGNIFRECYAGCLQYGGQGFGLRGGISVDRVTCTLPLVAADVIQFAAILTQVVLFKYYFLQASEKQRTAVQRSVLGAIFDALQPALHGLYVASFQREDATVDDLAEVSRTNSLDFFQVDPLFRLDGSWSGSSQNILRGDANERRLLSLRHYNAAIYHMENLASDRSPFSKLERLSRVCQEIDCAIKAFYELQPVESRPSAEQLNIAADDLCTLLSFILVSAPSSCLHIFTQLALLGSFIPESFAKGPEGYALTSCMAAVRNFVQLR